ncbi:MAG: helix-turn-helix transcriptional regulator [Treponema sp.]|nr:helix-turn-helix transcriptional regulator [Treponema sp.]MBQ5432536.1 helix-turn-helix transcriptional regulator [Treponema sp.]
METFAERLREEIDYLGLTRKELAFKANIKIRALDMYLGSQGSMPPADVAVRLAKALNITVEYLITGEDSSKMHESTKITDFEKELNSLPKSTQDFIKTTVHLFYKNNISI